MVATTDCRHRRLHATILPEIRSGAGSGCGGVPLRHRGHLVGQTGQVMPLSGTFDLLSFSDVLHLVAHHELTGRLHVRHRSFSANLFIEDGCILNADQSEHPVPSSAADVDLYLEEICFELLDSERGSFEFQPSRPGALPEGPTPGGRRGPLPGSPSSRRMARVASPDPQPGTPAAPGRGSRPDRSDPGPGTLADADSHRRPAQPSGHRPCAQCLGLRRVPGDQDAAGGRCDRARRAGRRLEPGGGHR